MILHAIFHSGQLSIAIVKKNRSTVSNQPVRLPPGPSRSSRHRPTDSTLRPLRGIRWEVGTWNVPGPSAAKTITSAAEARRVALLCGRRLDRLRVLAMASVVRLSGIGFRKV
jgi:hypothetical protein